MAEETLDTQKTRLDRQARLVQLIDLEVQKITQVLKLAMAKN